VEHPVCNSTKGRLLETFYSKILDYISLKNKTFPNIITISVLVFNNPLQKFLKVLINNVRALLEIVNGCLLAVFEVDVAASLRTQVSRDVKWGQYVI